MTKVLPLLVGTVLLSGAVHAQRADRPTQANGDCTGAISVTDTVFVVDPPVRGFGNVLEIKENPRDDNKWFEREHNTTWLKFRVPVACNLTFDIVPMDVEDDLDFLLFEGAIPGICDKVVSKQVTPLRSNISRNDLTLASQCGLSRGATEDFIRSGVGHSYSRSVDVEAGQLFYLAVDYQNRPRAGFTLRLHYDPPPPPEPTEEELKSAKMQRVRIHLKDANTGKPVPGNVSIQGMRFNEVVEGRGSTTYDYEMEMYRNLRISAVSQGYMFHNSKVKGSMEEQITIEVALLPITPGAQVILDDIRFVGNDDQVLRSSEGALLLLLRFMQENPRVKVEIQGHVNGPTFKNKKEFIELSEARARSVYNFLLVNDIEPDRISFVGIGNARMLYPDPKNKEQSEANRRVEIKVMGM